MPDYELRILIVEDEPLVAGLFERILSDDGYVVSTVSSGRDAVRHISDYDCSVAIVDMSLPDLEGAEVIRLILMERPYVKIIATTGMAVSTMRMIALEAGAVAVMGKPIDPDALRMAIFHLIDPADSWLSAPA